MSPWMLLGRRSPAWALVLGFFLAGCGAASGPGGVGPVGADGPYSWLLTGGRVVDGTGNGWFYGDVALAGDRVVAVAPAGTLDRSRADRVLDVEGLVVAPGFLDLNGQSDYGLLSDGRALSKLHQGITTEIMGENSTPAPRNERVTGPVDPSDSVAVRRARDWASFDGWLTEMEAGGISVNAASFLGAATVRRYAMGLSLIHI